MGQTFLFLSQNAAFQTNELNEPVAYWRFAIASERWIFESGVIDIYSSQFQATWIQPRMVNLDRPSLFVVFNPNDLHSIVMDSFSLVTGLAFVWMPLIALWFYIHWNDKCLTTTPRSAFNLSPKRWRPTDARMLEEKLSNSHVPVKALPIKTGRRYIIVGGVCLESMFKLIVFGHLIST